MKMDFSFNLYEPLWKPCYWEVYDCSHELVTPIVPLVMVSVTLNGSGWAPSRVLSLFWYFQNIFGSKVWQKYLLHFPSSVTYVGCLLEYHFTFTSWVIYPSLWKPIQMNHKII